MISVQGLYTFKLGHGLFYKECRTFDHVTLRNGMPVERGGCEYTRRRVSKATLSRFRKFGILSDIESGVIRSASIAPMIGPREAYEAEYTMTDGSKKTVVYYFDNIYGVCRTVKKSSSQSVPKPRRDWAMPKFHPDHAGERHDVTLKERVARAVERALGRNISRCK